MKTLGFLMDTLEVIFSTIWTIMVIIFEILYTLITTTFALISALGCTFVFMIVVILFLGICM